MGNGNSRRVHPLKNSEKSGEFITENKETNINKKTNINTKINKEININSDTKIYDIKSGEFIAKSKASDIKDKRVRFDEKVQQIAYLTIK